MNNALMQKVDKEIQINKEIMLTDILHSKVVASPDIDLCPYEGVCKLYKPHFRWLTPELIKQHTFLLRRTVEVIPAGTWLEKLLDPWYRGSWECKITPKPSVTPSKYINLMTYNYYL